MLVKFGAMLYRKYITKNSIKTLKRLLISAVTMALFVLIHLWLCKDFFKFATSFITLILVSFKSSFSSAFKLLVSSSVSTELAILSAIANIFSLLFVI